MMQFIVLGIVPGTDIQISFFHFANMIGVIAVVYLCWILYKEERHLRDEIAQYLEHINSISI